jgi:hypothetical protein
VADPRLAGLALKMVAEQEKSVRRCWPSSIFDDEVSFIGRPAALKSINSARF